MLPGGLRPPRPPPLQHVLHCVALSLVLFLFFEPRFSSIVSRCQNVQNGPFLVKCQILGFLVVEDGLLCVALRLIALCCSVMHCVALRFTHCVALCCSVLRCIAAATAATAAATGAVAATVQLVLQLLLLLLLVSAHC